MRFNEVVFHSSGAIALVSILGDIGLLVYLASNCGVFGPVCLLLGVFWGWLILNDNFICLLFIITLIGGLKMIYEMINFWTMLGHLAE